MAQSELMAKQGYVECCIMGLPASVNDSLCLYNGVLKNKAMAKASLPSHCQAFYS